MSILHAIILGLVQGITEFLPVSSSGHLAIVQSLLPGFEQPGLLYDTLLHVATLFAVLLFFRQRISAMIKGFFGIFFVRYRKQFIQQKSFIVGVIVATIPTGIIGFMLKDTAESFFVRIDVVGYLLILTSVLLFLSDKMKPIGQKPTFVSALFVGIIQGLAVFPGISRSGSTIFAGLTAGISRETAAEFSFLISIPAIVGATILQVKNISVVDFAELPAYGLGMAAAFLSGLFAIAIMINIVKTAKLSYFAVYCLLLGIVTVIWL